MAKKNFLDIWVCNTMHKSSEYGWLVITIHNAFTSEGKSLLSASSYHCIFRIIHEKSALKLRVE